MTAGKMTTQTVKMDAETLIRLKTHSVRTARSQQDVLLDALRWYLDTAETLASPAAPIQTETIVEDFEPATSHNAGFLLAELKKLRSAVRGNNFQRPFYRRFNGYLIKAAQGGTTTYIQLNGAWVDIDLSTIPRVILRNPLT